MNNKQLKIDTITDYCIEYDDKLILPAHPVLENPRSNSQFAILVPIKIIDTDIYTLEDIAVSKIKKPEDKIKTIYLLFNGNHYFFSKIQNNEKPELIIVDKIVNLTSFNVSNTINYISNINQMFNYYEQIFKNKYVVDNEYIGLYENEIKPLFAFNSLLLLVNLKEYLHEYYQYGYHKMKDLIKRIDELTIDICGDIGCSYTEEELVIHLNNLANKISAQYCWDGEIIKKEVRNNESRLQLITNIITKCTIDSFNPEEKSIGVYLYSVLDNIGRILSIFEDF